MVIRQVIIMSNLRTPQEETKNFYQKLANSEEKQRFCKDCKNYNPNIELEGVWKEYKGLAGKCKELNTIVFYEDSCDEFG